VPPVDEKVPASAASSLQSSPEPKKKEAERKEKVDFPPCSKYYHNSDTCKAQILSENKNKSGIYMWKNLINKKQYIGSSENLRARFLKYFNTNYLLRNTSMYICRALFKDGYSNFSLIIIEYCEPSKCLIREKHYWDIFKPEYNIAKDPTAPFSGRKHSDESKLIMSDVAKKSENTGRFTTGQERPEGAGRPYKQIEVFDNKNNIITSYDSMSEAARALNINKSVINLYFTRNQQKPYKGQYTFKKR